LFYQAIGINVFEHSLSDSSIISEFIESNLNKNITLILKWNLPPYLLNIFFKSNFYPPQIRPNILCLIKLMILLIYQLEPPYIHDCNQLKRQIDSKIKKILI
jgi:hypothetical protein